MAPGGETDPEGTPHEAGPWWYEHTSQTTYPGPFLVEASEAPSPSRLDSQPTGGRTEERNAAPHTGTPYPRATDTRTEEPTNVVEAGGRVRVYLQSMG